MPLPHQPEDQPGAETRSKTLGQKLQQIVIGSEVEDQRNAVPPQPLSQLPNLVRHRLAASLVLQGKPSGRPIHRDLDHSVVLLGISKGVSLFRERISVVGTQRAGTLAWSSDR